MLIYIFDGLGKKITVKNGNYIYDNNLQKEIEVAKNEWEYALRRFNDVSDPDVVDYIVYYIIAAERRYMYLLGKYKSVKMNQIIQAKNGDKQGTKE